jgi:peptide/nickel transport system substrate-binding protein
VSNVDLELFLEERMRGMSRAMFLRRTAMVGLSSTFFGGLLAGCGSSGDDATRAAGGETAAPAGLEKLVSVTPAATGPLESATWAVGYEPASLDWRICYATVENTIVVNITESLMLMTPEFGYEPGLAASYENPDPTKWIFKIRENVQFHDGSTMTADDVEFSLRRNMDPASFWAPWMTSIAEVKATGPLEVTVTLKQPDVLFLQMMAMPSGGVGKADYIKAKGENYGSPKGLPVGTGPYKVDAWTQGSGITLVAHDGYWDTAHAPKTKKIEFTFISDDTTLTNALTSGQVDGGYFPPFTAVPQMLGASATGTLYRGPSMLTSVVFFTMKEGPFRDPKVRTALSRAIDKPAIAKNVFNGAADALPDTTVPLAAWGYGKDEAKAAYEALAGPEANLEEAKKLFAEAGSPAGPVKVAVRSTQVDQDTGAVMQAAAKAIGLDMQLETLTAPQVVNLLYDEKARVKYDAFLSSRYYSDVADPVELLVEFLAPPEPGVLSYNYDEYDQPQVTELLSKARQSPDEAERVKLLIEAQALAAPDTPVLGLVAPASLVFLKKGVTGVPASFSFLYYPWARDLGAA